METSKTETNTTARTIKPWNNYSGNSNKIGNLLVIWKEDSSA